ncbi:MAG: hypothetical protein E7652_09245 [Ruminococcaceae bacterium]|nr:hypothetical protein [Oscillospiraceae bacterium]
MQGIREYVFSIMVITISSAALNMLAPEGKSISKYLHFLCALAVCCVILMPINSVFDTLPHIFDIDTESVEAGTEEYDRAYIDSLISKSIEIIEKDIKDSVEKKLECKVSCVSVEYNADDVSNIRIDRVRIGYKNENKYLFSDTENYVSELCDCECEVYKVE